MTRKKLDYASLFTLRKDGRYMARWTDEFGKRHSMYDRDPKCLYERVDGVKNGVGGDPVTFGSIASAWADKHFERIGWQTAHAYKPSLNRLIDRYGDQPAQDVSAQMISAYLAELGKKGYSRRTVQMHKDILNMIYNEAILSGAVTANPVAAVPMPRNLPSAKRTLPDDEAINAIRTKTDHPFSLFALICLYAGLRKGEALALRYEDVDRDKKVIHVTRSLEFYGNSGGFKPPKTEAGYRDAVLLDVLAEHIPKNKKGLIFAREDGQPFTQTCYRKRWESYCKYIGHNITAHQLRHGFATILFEAGVPDKDAQELLGHSSITVTKDIYTHIRQSRKQETADRLNDYLNR
jgi:integrase